MKNQKPQPVAKKKTAKTLGAGSQPAALAFLMLALSACSSVPTTKKMSPLPKKSNVVISRSQPPKKCERLGEVMGRSIDANGTRQQALDDLTQDAANKGANYVVVEQYSAYGTAVTGVAYKCP